MKRLITVRCLEENREVIKAIARLGSEVPDTYKATIASMEEGSPATAGNVASATQEKVVFVASKDLPKQDYHKAQIGALLEDIDRLTKQVEDMKVRLENCAKASDDDKTRYWMGRYKMLEKEAKERGWME